MKKYNPKVVEKKWQKIWQETDVYKADLHSAKPKYISMSMFNYPSGAGIHIGHAMNYTISDVLARFKRQQGYESYHPVGWDSFGLPAENYAIKAGVSPQESMRAIIPNYHKQYQAMGWSNDWSKEIATHTPEYYRWTQWIFSEMYRAGLAYQDARLQWWCDKCQTVLANEQVINAKCWRHDSADDVEVQQREVKQWFFKITDYADELLEATDALDWTDTVKTAQKNWIGRSEGVLFTFTVKDLNIQLQSYDSVPQTFKAQTFAVIAPEHPLVQQLIAGTEHEQPVLEMVEQIRKKKLGNKFEVDKDIEGVFTGRYLQDPFGTGDLPIWIASFVVADYGGGFVTCSAHDERDFAFAKKYNIPLRPVMFPQDKDLAQQVRDLEVCYHHDPEGVLEQAPEGIVGMKWGEAREPIIRYIEDTKMGTRSVQYKMRDWSVSRQRYWGAPIPIIYCEQCGPQLVSDSDLPVVLPELDNFQPSGDGRSALARATDWVNVLCPKCGGAGTRETDTLDTYICSSWYFLRYLDPHNTDKPFDKLTADRWMPVDFYNGADHATAHMLYARFVTRFFHKKGLLDTAEPFKRFLFNGKVTASDGQMFSKSKGNGVDPLEIIAEHGADALRTYLMFAAPLDLWVKWDAQGVPGAGRFLNRIWSLVHEFLQSPESVAENEKVIRFAHKTIKKVTADLESQKYNTAISSMMEMVNNLNTEKAESAFTGTSSWRFALESLVQLVAPFAPHMADELWEVLGHEDSVQKDHWPVLDESLVRESVVTLVVQVNGKVRGKLSVATGSSEEAVIAMAKEDEKIKAALGGSETKRVIFVPDKLLNLVV